MYKRITYETITSLWEDIPGYEPGAAVKRLQRCIQDGHNHRAGGDYADGAEQCIVLFQNRNGNTADTQAYFFKFCGIPFLINRIKLRFQGLTG